MKNEHDYVVKVSKKKLIVAVILIAFLSLLSVSYPSIIEKKTEPTVYVASKFGCLPLEYPYTDAQWEAAQNLYQSLYGFKLQRCNP